LELSKKCFAKSTYLLIFPQITTKITFLQCQSLVEKQKYLPLRSWEETHIRVTESESHYKALLQAISASKNKLKWIPPLLACGSGVSTALSGVQARKAPRGPNKKGKE
jgi:hypothetical protein